MNNSTQHHGQTFQPWCTPIYEIERAVLDTIAIPTIKTVEDAVAEWLKIIDARWTTIKLPSNFDALVNLAGLRFMYRGMEISSPVSEKLLGNIRIEKNRESKKSHY